ncbi:MAG: GNAT family N-acetyltransferase [Dehalococcoidia bacterium]
MARTTATQPGDSPPGKSLVGLYPPPLAGHGLVLHPWNEALLAQVAGWGARGFPYHAFDMTQLNQPSRAKGVLARMTENGPHRHFVAVEDGVAVGRASVNLRDEAGLYLWSVHVPPEHDGRGVCRRMLATLMEWLEEEFAGGPDFILSTNTFATHAHRAYGALGFETFETRWHYDKEIAEQLWRVGPEEREPVSKHVRFANGRWEVRTHLMRRRHGAPMSTGPRR